MRYLSATVLLMFGLVAQASPTTFYRALKHLGFDNKRIAKIVTGVVSQTNDNEVYVLITKKFKDVSRGYQFSQKKSGELVMQKFEVHSGVPSLSQKEIKEFGDRELVDFAMLRQRQVQQKVSAQQRVHQLLQGVIDDINNRKIIDIIEGRAKEIVKDNIPATKELSLARQQHLLSVLFTDKSLDKTGKIKVLFELLDISETDIAQKLSLPLMTMLTRYII